MWAKFAEQLSLSQEELKQIVSTKDWVEWMKLDGNQEIYAINGVLTFWVKEGKSIPLLSYLMNHKLPYPRVKVDLGAVKFMSKGADVMRPGVTEIDKGILPGDVVLVEDPSHGRILSVGEVLYSSEDMDSMEKGKIIKCIHSLTDPIWAFSKSFK
ncbi:MAG: RNA-binding protein [Candidatus Lokiarchaeota archaeon]|nr:RNA-binding protein [Candidatus Harpocratesius repetitus]